MRKLILIPLILLAVSGCTTLADSIAAKGTGKSKIYESSKEKAWPVVVNAVKNSNLDLISESKDSGMILAQRGITAFSYGENVAIFVEDKSENTCQIEVVSKKAMQTNIFAPDWSTTIFKNIDKELN
jgi:hypothetical protein